MEPICDSNYRRIYKTSGANYEVTVDKDWATFKLKDPDTARIIDDLSDYFRVVPLLKNVNAQILKCDVGPKYPNNPAMDHTMALCHSYFKFIRSEPSSAPSENSYDLSTSGGIPWCKDRVNGVPIYSNKNKILRNDLPRLSHYIYDLNYEDIGSYNDKDELLSTEELSRGKTRGIFGSSFHGIYREKFLYNRQNKAILENHANSWIKYGFVKQYGGFSKFLKTLESKTFRWESDCSGYDRKIYLKQTYEIRNANVINPDGIHTPLIELVTENNVHPKVLLPNGYLVKRKTGNNSGKNNTTVDNSISHFIINIYIFTKRLLELGYTKKDITLSHLFATVNLGIYSDDKLGSFNLHDYMFSSPDEFLTFERECYSEFGLEIKPSAQFYSHDESCGRLDPRHSFLGSYASFDEENQMYMPSPRFGKICSSFTQKYTNNDIIVRFARVLNLTLNCYPKTEIFQAALKYLTFFYDKHKKYAYLFDELLQEVELDMAVQSSFQRIYLGLESERIRNC